MVPYEEWSNGIIKLRTTTLARIGAMKIALGGGAVIGGSNDFFPNQCLEVKDIHICDHSAFGHETTALGHGVRLRNRGKRIEKIAHIEVDFVSDYGCRRAL